MRIQTKMLALTGAGCLSLLSIADGHHSYTRFDMARTLTLEGTVKEFQWTNPHVWVQLVVKDPTTGKEVEWSLESDSPNMLKRRGWTRTSLQPGDRAVAVIHPQKLNPAVLEGALDSITVKSPRSGAAPDAPATLR